MKLSELLNRTSVRLSIISAMLVAASLAAVFSMIYWQLSRELEQRIRQNVLTSVEALKAIDQRNGIKELSAVVASEASSFRDVDSIFLLVNKAGGYVAGNVDTMPLFAGWRTLAAADYKRLAGQSADADRYFALWTPVSEGSLLVGGNDRELRHVQATLLVGSAWSFVTTGLLAIAVGTLLALQAQRQIDAIADTLTAVSDGELDRRIMRTQRGDDLDQVSRAINATLDRLQLAINRVNHAASDIAHDLKQPLGRLQQKLELALRREKSTPVLQQAIETSLTDIDDLVDTFDAILRIAQIEAGARRASFADVDLFGVLQDVVEVYEAVAEDSGDHLVSQLDVHRIAPIRGDRELLIQLFANLVENAIRHSPKGATISIALVDRPDAYAAEVSDTGRGIPKSEREKVFDRFYRLEKSRTTPGTGLGLSLVAAITELHGAKISLGDNEPGLRVSIEFPKIVRSRLA